MCEIAQNKKVGFIYLEAVWGSIYPATPMIMAIAVFRILATLPLRDGCLATLITFTTSLILLLITYSPLKSGV